MHYVIKPREILISFFILFWSLTHIHLYQLASASHTLPWFFHPHLSAFVCTLLFLVTIHLFSFPLSCFRFTIFDSRFFQTLIFYLCSYFCIWFCSAVSLVLYLLITLYIEITIYSSVPMLDLAFELLMSLYYTITQTHTA